ncbi:MAG: alpha/beta hydrolase [Verrucomicrobiota bacterium]
MKSSRLLSGIPLLLLVGFLASACHSMRNDSASHSGRVLAADGLPVAYNLRGRGKTTLVFVHCWAGNRTFWRHQVEEFARDFQVLALDLPGHGQSRAPRESWSLQGLAQDLRTVIEQLKLRRVILIGHSMGGPVSLLAAERMPGRVLGVVGVDTLHNAEFVWPKSLGEQFGARFEADYEGTMRGMVTSMFPTNADPAVVQFVLTNALAADRNATVALIRDFPNLDLKRAFTSAKVPIRCINALPMGNAGLPTTLEANRKYADYDAVLMTGVGHYLQLERPSEFNQHLRKVLEKLSPP